jgi:hypothetical protein
VRSGTLIIVSVMKGCWRGAIVVAWLNVSLLAHTAQPFHRDDLISGTLNADNAEVRVTESLATL